MTNTEYITYTLSRFNITSEDVSLILFEADLSGTASADKAACKEAIYDRFSIVLPTANVSEGGYSVSWNMDAVNAFYSQLCKELNKPNVLQPKIRNRTRLW